MENYTMPIQTENRLQLIAFVFDEVNLIYFDGVIPTPSFHISTRMTHTAAEVFTDEWVMVISGPYHDCYGWEAELRDTIKHECVHLYLATMQRPDGHTAEFNAICARIGATRFCKPMPRRRPHYRYLVECPRCMVRQVLGSWKARMACGACCEKHNGGHYSSQFVLNLLKRTVITRPLMTK
jgi:predicted SprT family Zn-dependent metalloprotease